MKSGSCLEKGGRFEGRSFETAVLNKLRTDPNYQKEIARKVWDTEKKEKDFIDFKKTKLENKTWKEN